MVNMQSKMSLWTMMSVLILLGSSIYMPAAEGAEPEVDVETEVVIPQVVMAGCPAVAQIHITNRTQRPIPSPTDLDREDWDNLSNDEQRVLRVQHAVATGMSVKAFMSFSDHSSPFSVEIKSMDGEIITSHGEPNSDAYFTGKMERASMPGEHGASGFIEFRERRPHVPIRTNESAVFLLDIVPWIQGLEPGSYTMNIRLYRYPPPDDPSVPVFPFRTWDFPPVQFTLQELPEPDRQVIDQIVPHEVDAAGVQTEARNWLSPAINRQALEVALSHDVKRHVSFHLLAGQAASAESADELSQELIDALPEYLGPVADILRYELLLNEGKKDEAAALRAVFAVDHPEWVWMMDRAEKQGGWLKRVRESRAASSDTGSE